MTKPILPSPQAAIPTAQEVVLTSVRADGSRINLKVQLGSDNNPIRIDIDGDGDGEYRGVPIDYPRAADQMIPDPDDYIILLRPHERGFEGAARITKGGDQRETRIWDYPGIGFLPKPWNIFYPRKSGETISDNVLLIRTVTELFAPYKAVLDDPKARSEQQAPVAEALYAYLRESYAAYLGNSIGPGKFMKAETPLRGR